MKRAVVYARVSTGKQAKTGLSLEMQVFKCMEYAEAKGLEVADRIIDAGISAKSIAGRNGFEQVLEMIKSRKVAHVIAYKLDRTFRNQLEGLQAIALMVKKGVNLHVVDENGAVKTHTADDQFILSLKLSLAERERLIGSERTKAIQERKRTKGEFCGGEPPYGFRNEAGKLFLDAAEEKIIKKIRNLRTKGYTLRKIAARLTEDGHMNRRGRPFGKTQIERILARDVA